MGQHESPTATTTSSSLGARLHIWGPTIWAFAVLLAGLFAFQLSTQIAYSPRPGRLGPAFWPQVILIMLIITAAIDCFVEARKIPERSRNISQTSTSGAEAPRVWWLMALGLAATLAYINLSTLIGFPLANFCFMLAFMLIGGYRKPINVLLIATIGTLVILLLFVRVVYVSMPLGAGPFQDLTLLIYSLLGIV